MTDCPYSMDCACADLLDICAHPAVCLFYAKFHAADIAQQEQEERYLARQEDFFNGRYTFDDLEDCMTLPGSRSR